MSPYLNDTYKRNHFFFHYKHPQSKPMEALQKSWLVCDRLSREGSHVTCWHVSHEKNPAGYFPNEIVVV